ncbi:MAG: hypothetical protein V7K47_06930 [Nostoc sp.]
MSKLIFGIIICLLANTSISFAQDAPQSPTQCRGCSRREPVQLFTNSAGVQLLTYIQGESDEQPQH